MSGEQMSGFGYQTGWLAIRGGSASDAFAALGCREAGPVAWREGVPRAYREEDVVVTTPVLADGWILVMGRWVASRAEVLDVAQLSSLLGREVQLFVSHRVVDLHRWDRAVEGALVRSFEYLGEQGRVTRWRGAPDGAEASVGVSQAAYLAEELTVDEDDVMRIAGAWSVDPQALEGQPASGPLELGRFPGQWAEAPRRSAQVVSITDLILDRALSTEELNERTEQRLAPGESFRLRPGWFQDG